MHITRVTHVALATIIAGVSWQAHALGTASGTATDASASSAAPSPLARADQRFVREAAMGGMTEVELGKLAQQKAANAQVKQFGSRMVQDHGQANEELKQIAVAKGVRVPDALDRSHRKNIDKLSKLDGAAFDRAYMKDMLADHKKDISDFKKAPASAKDGEVKAFASKTLPTLQDHLQMAQAANDAAKQEK